MSPSSNARATTRLALAFGLLVLGLDAACVGSNIIRQPSGDYDKHFVRKHRVQRFAGDIAGEYNAGGQLLELCAICRGAFGSKPGPHRLGPTELCNQCFVLCYPSKQQQEDRMRWKDQIQSDGDVASQLHQQELSELDGDMAKRLGQFESDGAMAQRLQQGEARQEQSQFDADVARQLYDSDAARQLDNELNAPQVRRDAPKVDNTWACKACTFDNHEMWPQCGGCDARRQRD